MLGFKELFYIILFYNLSGRDKSETNSLREAQNIAVYGQFTIYDEKYSQKPC